MVLASSSCKILLVVDVEVVAVVNDWCRGLSATMGTARTKTKTRLPVAPSHSEPARITLRAGELSTDLDKPTNPTDDPKGTHFTTETDDGPAPASIALSRPPCGYTSRPAHRSATYRRTRYHQNRTASYVPQRVNKEGRMVASVVSRSLLRRWAL